MTFFGSRVHKFFSLKRRFLKAAQKKFVWYMLLAFVKIAQSETSRERLPDKMAKVTNVRLLQINNLRK